MIIIHTLIPRQSNINSKLEISAWWVIRFLRIIFEWLVKVFSKENLFSTTKQECIMSNIQMYPEDGNIPLYIYILKKKNRKKMLYSNMCECGVLIIHVWNRKKWNHNYVNNVLMWAYVAHIYMDMMVQHYFQALMFLLIFVPLYTYPVKVPFIMYLLTSHIENYLKKN